MEKHETHILKTRSATKGAGCRTESENHPAHARDARAYEENAIDVIVHHNERGGKQRGPAPKTEPEPDYDAEGMIPSN